MRKRIKMLILCLLSLILGVIIYTYFRPNTYIGNILSKILHIRKVNSNSFIVLSFYFPDYLWAFSLCSGLFAIYPLKQKLIYLWGIVTFIYGVLWEILQYYSIVSGTFDIVDIFMYFAAASSVVTIFYYINKENKQ